MTKAFALLGTKHRDITSYHSKTNGAVERFNDVLGHMLIKYCIGGLIKDWDIYLNQALFVTRIRTHTTTGFSSFYFLYGVNPILSGDADGPTPDLYDERIDSASFLSRERAEAFKKTMQRAKENKAVWDAKIKGEAFHESDKILIRTKKSKKFEVDWYGSYEVVRSEILNTYVLKSSGKSPNKYLISGDRMKLANVDEKVNKDWRMFRDRGRSLKAKKQFEVTDVAAEEVVASKRKRDRSRKVRNAEKKDSDGDYMSLSNDELFEDDGIV